MRRARVDHPRALRPACGEPRLQRRAVARSPPHDPPDAPRAGRRGLTRTSPTFDLTLSRTVDTRSDLAPEPSSRGPYENGPEGETMRTMNAAAPISRLVL